MFSPSLFYAPALLAAVELQPGTGPTNAPTTYGNQRARQGYTSIAKLNHHTGQPHSRVWAVARRRRRI